MEWPAHLSLVGGGGVSLCILMNITFEEKCRISYIEFQAIIIISYKIIIFTY